MKATNSNFITKEKQLTITRVKCFNLNKSLVFVDLFIPKCLYCKDTRHMQRLDQKCLIQRRI